MECLLGRWFLGVSFQATFLVFAAASLQLLTITHRFKTLGSGRFDGLLVWWVFVVWFWFYSIPLLEYVLARELLGVGFLAFLPTDHKFMVPMGGCHLACAVPLLWRHGGPWGGPGTILGHWGARERTLGGPGFDFIDFLLN